MLYKAKRWCCAKLYSRVNHSRQIQEVQPRQGGWPSAKSVGKGLGVGDGNRGGFLVVNHQPPNVKTIARLFTHSRCSQNQKQDARFDRSEGRCVDKPKKVRANLRFDRGG
ncbi:hypothetical protein FRC08_014930 [Ceratobasidium sp. 394]|nr:hypothetical protein FRC08_014930 [Ceratobasidium sp. 394]